MLGKLLKGYLIYGILTFKQLVYKGCYSPLIKGVALNSNSHDTLNLFQIYELHSLSVAKSLLCLLVTLVAVRSGLPLIKVENTEDSWEA